MLAGVVHDDIEQLSGAHVINLNTNQATYTLDNGTFKIYTKQQDTLQFSFVGYTTQKVIIKKAHLGIQEFSIKLKKNTIALDEIELKQHNLLGSLSSDIKNVKHRKLINANTLNLPNANTRKLTDAERRLYIATTSGGGIPLEYLINVVSGKIKQLKKELAVERKDLKIKTIDARYRTEIISYLNIDSVDVDRFVYFIGLDENFEHEYHKNEFEFIKYLQEQSKLFKKLKNDNFAK